MLCDVLPEDRVLREELQRQKLVRVVLKDQPYVGNTQKSLLFLFVAVFTFYFGNFQTYTKEETIHQDFKTESKCTLDWRLKHFMLKMQKGFWALFCFLDYL